MQLNKFNSKKEKLILMKLILVKKYNKIKLIMLYNNMIFFIEIINKDLLNQI